LSFTINLKSIDAEVLSCHFVGISGIGGVEALLALALVVQTLFPNLFGDWVVDLVRTLDCFGISGIGGEEALLAITAAWVVALVRTLDCFGISGIGGVEALLALALVVHTILLYTPFIVSGRLVKRALSGIVVCSGK
jgi:hypothetical protein